MCARCGLAVDDDGLFGNEEVIVDAADNLVGRSRIQLI